MAEPAALVEKMCRALVESPELRCLIEEFPQHGISVTIEAVSGYVRGKPVVALWDPTKSTGSKPGAHPGFDRSGPRGSD